MNNQPEHVAAFEESLANEMLAFCGPIFIAPGIDTYPAQVIDNGTYSLIDTGQRRIMVTCHHVWQAFLDCRADSPKAVLCLSLGEGDANIAFTFPERQLIDTDPDLDLAVFDFGPNQLLVNEARVNHQKNWFRIQQWPIPKASNGDYLVLMGFPGKRVKKDGRLCQFTTQAIPLKLSGVGHKELLILNQAENVEVFNDIKNWLGGLSGSPAYTLNPQGASLAGFVKAGYKRPDSVSPNTGKNSLFAGSLLLTHAQFLQPDGTLLRPQ